MKNQENKPQHTKVEWIVKTTLSNIAQTQWRCIIKTIHGVKVAEAYGSTREEAEANARLIASAPDMLEALKEARFRLTCLKGLAEYPELKTIEKAIAKAEGRE